MKRKNKTAMLFQAEESDFIAIENVNAERMNERKTLSFRLNAHPKTMRNRFFPFYFCYSCLTFHVPVHMNI